MIWDKRTSLILYPCLILYFWAFFNSENMLLNLLKFYNLKFKNEFQVFWIIRLKSNCPQRVWSNFPLCPNGNNEIWSDTNRDKIKRCREEAETDLQGGWLAALSQPYYTYINSCWIMLKPAVESVRHELSHFTAKASYTAAAAASYTAAASQTATEAENPVATSHSLE